ncbi:MAG: V-type ATP synthase subunit D [Clostridiales bacterium]|jgi:V/A-type H+-transporting ATPase subunit D|nr:V-type ATP synthase subunit D [Clostridiales bacterium]
MEQNEFPTKGNLILAKNTLKLSKLGYDLLDKKRSVLIREIMLLNEHANEIQEKIDCVFTAAYAALQAANIEMGISSVERFSYGIPREETVRVRARSIMGVEVPVVDYENATRDALNYGFGNTTVALDEAYRCFNDAKDLIIRLAAVENSAHRLAVSIRKTQKRANALKNVTIPKYEARVKLIQETLEERDRDEFTRLKVIKGKRQ